MKFDLYRAKLQTAIARTLARLGTLYEIYIFKIIIDFDNVDMKKQCKYFLKNIKFAVIIDEIQKFIELIFEAIVNEKELNDNWETIHIILAI